MTVLVDDPSEGPPNTNGALVWKQQFNLTSIYVAADPIFSMVPSSVGSFGTPQQTVINPRNMQVVLRQEGFSGQAPAELIQLAQQNQP
jgi:hypothetical protein